MGREYGFRLGRHLCVAAVVMAAGLLVDHFEDEGGSRSSLVAEARSRLAMSSGGGAGSEILSVNRMRRTFLNVQTVYVA